MRIRGAKAVALLGLWLVAGCRTTTPAPLAHVEAPRVVLAPVSFDRHVPESLEAGIPVVADRIAAYLDRRGCEVDRPSFSDFDDLWRASAASVGSIRGEDGKVSRERYDQAILRLVASLNERQAYDAIVLPYLLLRKARVRGQTGVWDDSQEKVRIIWEHTDRYHMESVGMEVPATSLQVRVFAGDGKTLHEDTKGLQLMTQIVIRGDKWSMHGREDLFEDRKDLDREIRRVLAPVFE